MKFTITAPAYLPKVEYFIPFINCDKILFADHLQYVKRSSITKSAQLNKGNILSIPVKHLGVLSSIKSMEIATDQSWNINHLKTIRHQYNTYPFFEEYNADISNHFKEYNSNLGDFQETSERLAEFYKKS